MGLGETTRLGEVGRLGDFGERGELGLELPELTFLGFGLPGFLPAFPLGGFVVIFNYKTLCPSPPPPAHSKSSLTDFPLYFPAPIPDLMSPSPSSCITYLIMHTST